MTKKRLFVQLLAVLTALILLLCACGDNAQTGSDNGGILTFGFDLDPSAQPSTPDTLPGQPSQPQVDTPAMPSSGPLVEDNTGQAAPSPSPSEAAPSPTRASETVPPNSSPVLNPDRTSSPTTTPRPTDSPAASTRPAVSQAPSTSDAPAASDAPGTSPAPGVSPGPSGSPQGPETSPGTSPGTSPKVSPGVSPSPSGPVIAPPGADEDGPALDEEDGPTDPARPSSVISAPGSDPAQASTASASEASAYVGRQRWELIDALGYPSSSDYEDVDEDDPDSDAIGTLYYKGFYVTTLRSGDSEVVTGVFGN